MADDVTPRRRRQWHWQIHILMDHCITYITISLPCIVDERLRRWNLKSHC